MSGTHPKIAICNPLLGTGEVRVDTRSDDVFGCYGLDERIFAAQSKRSSFVRRSYMVERFDVGEDLEMLSRKEDYTKSLTHLFQTRPPLFVAVTRVGASHLIVPVFRGKAFFRLDNDNVAITSSDAEVGSLLQECSRRGGLDSPAWNEWAAKLNAAAKEYREKHPVENSENPMLVGQLVN